MELSLAWLKEAVMLHGDTGNVSYSGSTPVEAYRKYMKSRLARGFDTIHYPTLDHFWLHENDEYTLWIIYRHDATPNM